jgi:hypothetical protein
MGLRADLTPKDLAESGWGVIFAHQDQDKVPAVKEALGELLRLRQSQAGQRYKEYTGSNAYRPGETKVEFLARHGAGPGPVDPDRVPYYLLIVGSPDAIPYKFQRELDLQYAVGRIYFETPDEYANYAQAAARAEFERPPSGRLASFQVTHPDDRHMQVAADRLTTPLLQALADRYPQWMQQKLTGAYATKAALHELLGSSVPPSLLFCVSHGIVLPPGHPQQEAHQGALLCADWPGPAEWSGPIPPDMYFSAEDLSADMNLAGMIAFLWASYSAGTPQYDLALLAKARAEIAPTPFTASLPTKMLGRPNGALAVVGLADRAWGYSANWGQAAAQTAAFEAVFARLFDGHPLGSAMEYFNERFADLASHLSSELEDLEFGAQPDPKKLATLWTDNNDMRNIVLLGDPAVRLTRGAIR